MSAHPRSPSSPRSFRCCSVTTRSCWPRVLASTQAPIWCSPWSCSPTSLVSALHRESVCFEPGVHVPAPAHSDEAGAPRVAVQGRHPPVLAAGLLSSLLPPSSFLRLSRLLAHEHISA
jgi:hypothetical protein